MAATLQNRSSQVAPPEHPILFSGPMVRAILGPVGPKTQTRRPVKTQPPCDCNVAPEEMSATTPEGWQAMGHSGQWWCPCCTGDWRPRCPFGVPGDRLWVRETWADLRGMGFLAKVGYRADSLGADGCEDADAKRCRDDYGVRWRPSIHMPRWACRILLDVLDVRVERLAAITESDAIAEGFESRAAFLASFRTLYDLPDHANPWLWAITFKRKRAA